MDGAMRERLKKFASFDLANKLIEQANKSAQCDAECMKEKEKGDFKLQYDNAQTALNVAPDNLRNARRNYYVYSYGEKAYDDYRETEIKKLIDKLSKKLTANHTEFITTIKANLDSYEISTIYYKNMLDMYKQYKGNFNEMSDNLEENRKSFQLNARRVDYEEDELVRMNFYVFVAIICYFLCFIVVVAMGLFFKLFRTKESLLIFAFAIFYPFIIPIVLRFIYKGIEYLGTTGANTNVYLNGSTM